MNRRLISPAIAIVLSALLAAPALASDPPAKPADNSPKLAYGLMMKQGGKVLFSPCRDRSYALVEDVSNDGRVFKGLNMVGLGSGKRLYAELVGVVENGVLKASELNHLEELQAWFLEHGYTKFRGKQVYEWLWKKTAHEFDLMSNLPLPLRETLKEHS